MRRSALLTAEDLMHINLPNKRAELVRGVLVVREPPGYNHGYVLVKLTVAISKYVDANDLGQVSTVALTASPAAAAAPETSSPSR